MPHLDTLLAHAGCAPDPTTGALVAPPVLSSTFLRAADGSYPGGFVYARADNPTRQALETLLAQLEGGAEAAAFASGMAAIHAVLQALPPGSHIVLADDVYFGVRHLLDTVFEGLLTYTPTDLSVPGSAEAAFTDDTRMVWAETPSNPLLRITDLAALARVTKARGVLLAVDGTWTTPLLQRPLDLGADLVVHSLTKYMAGHSDVLGGAVVARDAEGMFARIRNFQKSAGPVLDPFSAWLTLRGLRSLRVRLDAQVRGARHVAAFLDAHPAVDAVYYPGLDAHAGYAIARQQMAAPGAMLSIVLADEARARAVAGQTQVFKQATSLGGTESLIEHRASLEGPGTRAPEGLLRLSIGLEHPGDLTADLEHALS